MIWFLVIVMAAVVFALLLFVFRIPRGGRELAGAALLLGFAGYALQGKPGLPSAPKVALESGPAGAANVADRQVMDGKFGAGQNWLVLADAMSRNGQYASAAEVLRKATTKEPKNPDLWIALGNALVGHSDGVITPAAQFAFQRAADIEPRHPGPPFFMGLALAQSGKLDEARTVWSELLGRTPKDATYRADLEQRLARLDEMIAMQGGGPTPPAAAAAPQAEPAASGAANP